MRPHSTNDVTPFGDPSVHVDVERNVKHQGPRRVRKPGADPVAEPAHVGDGHPIFPGALCGLPPVTTAPAPYALAPCVEDLTVGGFRPTETKEPSLAVRPGKTLFLDSGSLC